MALYTIWNGPSPTTAKQVAVTTGTAIKTLLQVQPSATAIAKIKQWMFRCDAPSAQTLAVIELLETDVAATVTAHVAAGIVKTDADAMAGGDPTTNLFTVGTGATGYTSGGAEGTITTSRMFDQITTTIPTSNGYEYTFQWPLGQEPRLTVAKFLRIRTHFGTAANAVCGVVIEI